MFGSTSRGANAYASVGMETGVAAATPHKLTLMLMDGASIAIAMATKHMRAGAIKEKGKLITQAILIIDNGLRASLNHKVGDGELAGNLEALYSYMTRTLFTANVKNQPELLEEVHGLLSQIKEAWEAIDPDPRLGGVPGNASNASNFGGSGNAQYLAKI
ncbi:flagellar export chaperone FliS [Oxalobacteraceae bacterium CAVE-383]|nr:flagellar export chaperone FliS [Oxalobacteraceae bacterium CAVE-383]